MKVLSALLLCFVSCAQIYAQVHERKVGASFQIGKPYEVVYDRSITYMHKAGHTISGTDRDAGQIASAIGSLRRSKLKETGFRVFLTIVKEDATKTSVEVVVEQYEHANPKWGRQAFQRKGINLDETKKVADELLAFLQQTPEAPTDGPNNPQQ